FDDFWKVTNGVDDGRDGDALKAARRAIISNSQIDIFNAKVVAEFGKPPFNCVNECMGGPNDQIPASYARSLHDTTYAYLRALNKTTEKFGYLTKDLARNGTLINNMSKGEFQGETGLITFDDNGNRQPNFFLTMLDISDQANVVMNITVIEQYVGDSFVMFTLMRDIASGLIALHGSFAGAHGMLSSENCLINDRWQVKISDFGLNMIRESQPMSKRSNKVFLKYERL
uniref:guanylate cyclase n=1 Tax=Meloidogyne javanica TaxID=6303 RepID=A0A915LJM5_MELJA